MLIIFYFILNYSNPREPSSIPTKLYIHYYKTFNSLRYQKSKE